MKKLISNTVTVLTHIGNVLGSDERLERVDGLKYRSMYDLRANMH